MAAQRATGHNSAPEKQRGKARPLPRVGWRICGIGGTKGNLISNFIISL